MRGNKVKFISLVRIHLAKSYMIFKLANFLIPFLSRINLNGEDEILILSLSLSLNIKNFHFIIIIHIHSNFHLADKSVRIGRERGNVRSLIHYGKSSN